MTASEGRASASFGEVLERLSVGMVSVTRRYGCVRRDQYELTAPRPFPAALRDRLAARGSIKGSAALYVLDVQEAFQLTVAPLSARALLMPRLSTEPPFQRSAALEMAALLDAELRAEMG
ncbi:Hypothetical protein A7982_05350 [Minicystis rosea]|nr:Hypothetical protein A7982_05350 [Minicystis rosea]